MFLMREALEIWRFKKKLSLKWWYTKCSYKKRNLWIQIKDWLGYFMWQIIKLKRYFVLQCSYILYYLKSTSKKTLLNDLIMLLILLLEFITLIVIMLKLSGINISIYVLFGLLMSILVLIVYFIYSWYIKIWRLIRFNRYIIIANLLDYIADQTTEKLCNTLILLATLFLLVFDIITLIVKIFIIGGGLDTLAIVLFAALILTGISLFLLERF